jgi:hypothetical protein
MSLGVLLVACHSYLVLGRGTQVVRERSAKPLCVSSILTRASTFKILKTNRIRFDIL